MDHSCCHVHQHKPQFKLGKKLKIVGAIFLVMFAVSFLPSLSVLNESLISYIKMLWWSVLLGLLAGGLIEHFVPSAFIFKYLGQKKKRTLFYAVFSGFLLSACSHGILAIAIQLFKKGASVASVIAFLLASPWANLPMTFLMFGIFGWKAAVFIVSAMGIALITGAAFLVLDHFGWIEKSLDVSENQISFRDTIKNNSIKDHIRGVAVGAVNLANMVLWWTLIGFMAAALIRTYVPTHFFMHYLGPDMTGLFVTLFFATIIEVCSEGSSPLAFEIYHKVGALGNPFVFLMAGVVTDYTEIGLLWSNIGKRTALWLPVIAVPQVLLFGYLFNLYL